MDRELIFKAVQEKDFDKAFIMINDNYKEIEGDPILGNAVSIFIDEVLNMRNILSRSDVNYRFFQIYLIDYRYHILSKDQFQKVIVGIIESAGSVKEKLDFAAMLPDNEYCKKIVDTLSKELPKEIDHSQASKIEVKEISVNKANSTKSIFNSQQERTFFFALRNCFPNHFIYPNIGVSTIINKGIADAALQSSEIGYYFSSSIDFAIIDQFHDFKPICAIELDSEWHRLHGQDKKDAIKNKLLQAAGLPTFRIEHFSKFKTVEEFQKVIMETVKFL